jgi:predicted DsbA family dithiol-disulfide isomerase
VARAAHSFALANPNITSEVVEVQEFPELARKYQVMGVPKTVINDETEFVGAVPDELFLSAIFQALGYGQPQSPPDQASDEPAG